MAKIVFLLRREAAESPARFRSRLQAWKNAKGWLTAPQDPPCGLFDEEDDCRQGEFGLVVPLPVVERAS